MNNFFDSYKAYLWIKECEKYESDSFCVDYMLARKSLKLLFIGMKVDTRSLIQKIKHMPFTLTRDEMIADYRKLPYLPIKDELERYIILYEPNANRVKLFLEGYKKIMSDNITSILTGIAKIVESKINIKDDIIRQKIEKLSDVVILDLDF